MAAPILKLTDELRLFTATVLEPMWEDRGNAGRWCERWYEHPEVLNRVQDMYEGWNLIGDEMGDISLNMWFRSYLDHHMSIITSVAGPLRTCGTKHSPNGSVWEIR